MGRGLGSGAWVGTTSYLFVVGKQRRVQVRQQVRKIQPKAATAPTKGQTKRQRERFVQAGGMLQGYAPDLLLRVGYISIGVAVAFLVIMAALLIFLPPVYGLPVAIAAAVAWVLPIALLASFIGPGF